MKYEISFRYQTPHPTSREVSECTPQILNGEAQLITEVSFNFAAFVLLIKLLHPNSNQLKL